MRRIRTIAVFPTLLTLANLVCGFFAIVVASRIDAPTDISDKTPATEQIGITHIAKVPWTSEQTDPTLNIMFAAWLIVIAMVFDALDGRVARMVNQTTDFGAQLDSLCDLVTFGVAPGFLMVKMCPSFSFEHRHWVWIIAAIFASCAALRLARFNVETTEEDDHRWFSGLPAPAAAAAIAGFALVFYKLRSISTEAGQAQRIDEWVQWILPVFMVLVSLLMVSRIPYPHLVNQFVRGQRSFSHFVAIVFVSIPILVFPGYAVPFLAAIFALGPPPIFLWRRYKQRQTQREPLF